MNTKFRFFNKCFSKVCEECNGKGYWKKYGVCNAPQSDCCGGCYESNSCDECDGEGIVRDFEWRLGNRIWHKENTKDIFRFRRSCWISLHVFNKKYKPFKKL